MPPSPQHAPDPNPEGRQPSISPAEEATSDQALTTEKLLARANDLRSRVHSHLAGMAR
ncbi:hypothetical protein [Streptomyces profundus]|uniref:hypothetical protein n=1 Tax=Streptomyces profundus TaxID=2867410 RepID=UPI001D15F9BA|nr:hypothetical protein [Streptomyces sp. MA3_2.13]UED85039.1 hypothetical protein K4G22_13200 [Streptomyces sp. MA3_2.13]